MRGRKPLVYRLGEADRQYLHEILEDGQLIQRVANRARALLALDQGERIAEIAHWLGWSRMGLWQLWQRYQEWGVAAVFDAERCGRPAVFSPVGACPYRTRRVHGSRSLRAAPGPLGLPQPAARGGGAGRRGLDPLHDRRPDLGSGQPAAASPPVLEDRDNR